MNCFLVWYKVRLVIFGLNRIRLHSVRTNDGRRQYVSRLTMKFLIFRLLIITLIFRNLYMLASLNI